MADGYVQDELTRLRLKLLEQVSRIFWISISNLGTDAWNMYFVINRKLEASQPGILMEWAFIIILQTLVVVRFSTAIVVK